jgi:hypothetical protein
MVRGPTVALDADVAPPWGWILSSQTRQVMISAVFGVLLLEVREHMFRAVHRPEHDNLWSRSAALTLACADRGAAFEQGELGGKPERS